MAQDDGVGPVGVVVAGDVGSVVGELVAEGAVLDGPDGDGPAPVAALAVGGSGVAGGEASWTQADRNSVATIAPLTRRTQPAPPRHDHLHEGAALNRPGP
jgi:hypothetical protein